MYNSDLDDKLEICRLLKEVKTLKKKLRILETLFAASTGVAVGLILINYLT